jgi:pyruvate dehydrogenase E2 component (dihydrolipoamide acetyltransferase)
MATEIVMPQLGLTMTEGTLVRWLKREGDPVQKGEVLFEVETDKVTQEVEAQESGVLRRIHADAGTTLPIGTVIGVIAAANEALPESAVSIAEPSVTELNVAPLAARLAERHGVELRKVRGTGVGGRIVREDVERVIRERGIDTGRGTDTRKEGDYRPVEIQEEQRPRQSRETPVAVDQGRAVRPDSLRALVAQRMTDSFATVPHFYLTAEVDAGNLMAARAAEAEAVERAVHVRLTVTDLLIQVVAQCLQNHPLARSSWADGEVHSTDSVNVGVAVATPHGLVVPVIHNADRLSLVEIAEYRSRVVELATTKRLKLDDVEGGVFTLSNLGVFGVDFAHAIINPPQSAILAVGRIRDRVCARGGEITIRPSMYLTLSADHRVLDGAAAAALLQAFQESIETRRANTGAMP